MMEKETLLLRQVHPSFVQGDNISTQVFSSQVFTPTEKDNNLLSTYNGDKFSADESFYHFESQGFKTSGVVAVSNAECQNESLPVIEDNYPFDGHCSIDYNGLSSSAAKKKAKKLKKRASDRGWLFQK